MRLLPAFVVCGLLAVGGVACGQSNLVLFVSSPGDYIGQGLTYVTTNAADLSFSGTPSFVQASAFGYTFSFDVPSSSNLAVGIYTNASRLPFNGSGPGIDISGNGRGCNTECGTFQILEIHTNSSGQVDHFWGTFSNRCECYFSPMTGEIRYNSLLAPPPPPPNTLRVPVDYLTIQAAINASVSGDTILVAPGVYVENINFIGKTITVESEAGPASTIIDGNQSGSVVVISSGEGRSAVLKGFTIRNGYTGGGGGINISSSSPTIIENIITNNHACSGCGISINFASPLIQSNKISGNTSSFSICSGGAGGGLYIGGAASAEILDNEISDNVPNDNNGGGMELFAAGTPTIRNNLIKGNTLYGIAFVNYSDALIVQNIIVSNDLAGIIGLVPTGNRGPYIINNTVVDNNGAQIAIGGSDNDARIINNIIVGPPDQAALYCGPGIFSNNVYNGTANPYAPDCIGQTNLDGNISTDPLFVNRAQGDYHLQAISLCIDAGNNGVPGIPSEDYDGNQRIVDGNGDHRAVIDQGAYEFIPSAITISCPSNIVVAANPGDCFSNVIYPLPVATGGAGVDCRPPSGSGFPLGSTTVICSASNGSVSVVSCVFTVTVNDTSLPAISCPPAVTVTCASQVPPPDFAGGSATDNCVGVTVTWGGDFTNRLTCPDRFTIQRRYDAMNANGQSVSCVQNITVNNTSAPIITCPANVRIGVDPGKCTASGVALGGVSAIGSCDDEPIISNNAPGQFPQGTNTVVWTVTDRCGNSSTCTQLVIVINNQPPIINCPADIVSNTAPGACGARVTWEGVTSVNNCGTVNVACTPVSGSLFAEGITKVTCTAANGFGDTTNCSFLVTVMQPAGCAITVSGDSRGTTVCEGNSVILTAPNGMKRYLWTGPEQTGANVQTIVVRSPGTYYCTQEQWYGSTNCCSVTVTVNPRPSCNITGSLLITNGQPTTLVGPDGMMGQYWTGPQNNGLTSQSNSVILPGAYTLHLTDSNGCQSECTITVLNRTPAPCSITASGDSGGLAICQGSTTFLTGANGMAHYLWSGPEQNGATTKFIIVGTPGLYTVQQIDSAGLTNTCSVSLVVNPPPAVNLFGNRVFCQGSNTTLYGPDGMKHYLWFGPQNNGLTTRSNTVSVPGTYTLAITGSNGCQNSLSFPVTIVPCPQGQ